mmetsp:Transcript_11652/g.48473  ORF Transcript_11652/g.48473 Transcript_11652/m.48473 type:complete len:101 (+) Transcript_11652:1536-1838(+)
MRTSSMTQPQSCSSSTMKLTNPRTHRKARYSEALGSLHRVRNLFLLPRMAKRFPFSQRMSKVDSNEHIANRLCTPARHDLPLSVLVLFPEGEIGSPSKKS